MFRWAKWLALIVFLGGVLFAALLQPASISVHAQQPTGSVPTVTGTPSGPYVIVDQSLPLIRVYAGPSRYDYPEIGVMLGSETAPAIGRARGNSDWIQIYYPGVPGSVGWVYGLYVKLSSNSNLPLVDIPPTPTPFSTPTINPTLVAAFIGQQTPTRLPTFTLPAPLEAPSFSDADTSQTRGVPAGLMILGLGLVGFFGAVISYLRGR